MVIKPVTNLKILITVIMTFCSFFLGYSQIKPVIHLSFNIVNHANCTSKVINKNGVVDFYIGPEHFSFNSKKSKVEQLPVSALKNIDLQTLHSLKEKASNERKRLIAKGSKNKSIKILLNNQVFDKIYLYEKINPDTVKRYQVIWVEEIE